MNDKNRSPVGWYVASYHLRFIELSRRDLEDPDARFLSWENTILIKALDLDEAFDRTVHVAMNHTRPYKGGPAGVDVHWSFEGVTEIVPIYEELEDGAEILWTKYRPRKLRNIRKRIRGKSELADS